MDYVVNETQGIRKIEAYLNEGKIFQAHNLASELQLDFPDNVRLAQLNALALLRLNQYEKGLGIVEALVGKGHHDSETMGLQGRIYKDLYKETGILSHLKKAAKAYLQGFENTRDYYPAINAASMFALLGERKKSKELADIAVSLISSPQDYWAFATLGEAMILLEEEQKASNFFIQAINIDKKQFGQFKSTLTQLYLLRNTLDIPDQIIHLFPKPQIAVFSGHMIDHPQRETPRFPPYAEKDIARKIDQLLEEEEIDIAFTSLACGSDILFIEALTKKPDASLHLYLPFKKSDFIETSVAFAGKNWMHRFEVCIEGRDIKYLNREAYLDTPDLFAHLGKVMMGEALVLADQYLTTPLLLTVLAEDQERKRGGTHDLRRLWPYPGSHKNIDPSSFLIPSSKSRITIKADQKSQINQEVKLSRGVSNILFADIVGFSKLLEEETPTVILSIFSEIKHIINSYKEGVEVINTWGDAILLCHKNENDLLAIAIGILKLFTNHRLKLQGLPPALNIRLALHSGPVFLATDPLTNEANVYGSSINLTARMEPVTLPGSIYVSDQFAAIVRLTEKDKYRLQHVGVIELPKGFGRQEVYRIAIEK